jgi:hypothetical protein
VPPEGGAESRCGCALFGSMCIASMKLSRYLLHRPAGTAVDALLDIRAESLQLGGPELLANFKGPEPVTEYLPGAGVRALLDLAIDELLEVFPDEVARRHGWLPVAGSLVYQKLIVTARGFRPGPITMVVKGSSSTNYDLLTMASHLLAR